MSRPFTLYASVPGYGDGLTRHVGNVLGARVKVVNNIASYNGACVLDDRPGITLPVHIRAMSGRQPCSRCEALEARIKVLEERLAVIHVTSRSDRSDRAVPSSRSTTSQPRVTASVVPVRRTKDDTIRILLVRDTTACPMLEKSLSAALKRSLNKEVQIDTFNAGDAIGRQHHDLYLVLGYTSSSRLESSRLTKARASLLADGANPQNVILICLRYGSNTPEITSTFDTDGRELPMYNIAFQSDGVIWKSDMTERTLRKILARLRA